MTRSALGVASVAVALALSGCSGPSSPTASGSSQPSSSPSSPSASPSPTGSAPAGATVKIGRIASSIDANLCVEQVGSFAKLEPCNSSTGQQWRFSNQRSPTPDGAWYQIQNVGSGDYLDVDGNFTGQGGDDVTVSSTPANADTTQWSPAASGVLTNLTYGGQLKYCMFDPSSSPVYGQGTPTAGTVLWTWTCNGSAGERWRLPVSG